MNRDQHSTRRINWESVVIPIVLMLTGLILVGGDYFGVLSLDRIQNLWPAAVILIGLTELTHAPDGRKS